MRFVILFLLVLTFSPFDMENDYCLMFQFEMATSVDSETPQMIGKYRGDSHHDCACLLCIAAAGNIYLPVISSRKEAEKGDSLSPIPIASPFYLKVFRPPRA